MSAAVAAIGTSALTGLWIALSVAVTPAAAEAQPGPARASVVFFAPEVLSPEVRSALEDALATQLSLLNATIYYAGPAKREGDPSERVKSARDTAARYGATAIFWLDAPRTQPWVLYAADAGITRVVARRLGPQRASVEADIEMVALIVRATTDALLRGEPMPAEEDQAEDDGRQSTPWPVELLWPGSSAVRVSGAYTGTTFAKQRRWQQGLSLRAAWIWPSGSYLGLGFTMFERLKLEADSAELQVERFEFQIDRYPVSLHAGLRFPVSVFTFIGELGVELEFRNRRTSSIADPEVTAQGPERSSVLNVCPKLETEVRVFSWLAIFGGVGLDFVVGNFPYNLKEDMSGKRVTVLEPYLIRLNVQAGVALLH